MSAADSHFPINVQPHFFKTRPSKIANLKTWLLGAHHGVSQQHLQSYLNEFVFRFNRRFYPMTAFNSVLGLVANATAPTYERLY
jgi:hypothetical protein